MLLYPTKYVLLYIIEITIKKAFQHEFFLTLGCMQKEDFLLLITTIVWKSPCFKFAYHRVEPRHEILWKSFCHLAFKKNKRYHASSK